MSVCVLPGLLTILLLCSKIIRMSHLHMILYNMYLLILLSSCDTVLLHERIVCVLFHLLYLVILHRVVTFTLKWI